MIHDAGASSDPENHIPLPAVAGSSELASTQVPALFARAGDAAARRFVEFFVVTIRNRHTRAAYAEAVAQFAGWCDGRHVRLESIRPIVVAAYVEHLTLSRSAPTVKQHLAAIRMLFDWLVTGHVVAINPAWSVRGPRHVVKRGTTQVLDAHEARALLDSIDTETLIGLRDRALIGLMCYSFARVSAAANMNVEDFRQQGATWWIVLHEKNGKLHQVPAHHNARRYLEEYIDAAGIRAAKRTPLFRTGVGRSGALSSARISRSDVFRMIRRRGLAAGIAVDRICCHTFRATGITAYLRNGGSLEHAQAIAGHESPRTTKLYDRTSEAITIEEIERVGIQPFGRTIFRARSD